MFSIMVGKTVSLAPTSDSAPFTTKYIPLGAAAVVLGRTHATDGATHTNGMFALGGAPSSDLPVSEAHAQLYTHNGQVYIDDLGSAHGTWVDGQKIKIPTPLRTGSIIELGVQRERTAGTPASITDEYLKPVAAKVTVA
ncbi:forkhead-associated protein 1 [Heterobasidion irregulare TC 32-1]|uniref:Forkhead-associated protein 1 n=1 Tax=Heterobasidion irregulare (strain TC 32-1) TaxID=747525 RepID=W4JT44_HETIT|nr:forkhead-associated protein 1 [Heterobasidion irregulare TC 32-1]ETW76046.1 forkhead-associated protein 1 [Heterobasidion irregulare TC 32-1]